MYGHIHRATFPQAKWVGGAGSRHLSQEQTRTCQAGRARWATLSDTLAGILPTKASSSSCLPSTEQPGVWQQAAPAQGWAWEPQLSNKRQFPPLFSHRGPEDRAEPRPSMQTEGLTSWRMSSSLGMMESSRVSSLQRQGESQATGDRVWGRGIQLQGPGWGRGVCMLPWKEEGRLLTCSGSAL